MKRVWKWIGSNASTLEGLAAMVVLVGALVVIPGLFSRLFRPDVIVRIHFARATVPPDLKQWLIDLGRVVQWQEKILESKENAQQELAALLGNPIVKKLQRASRGLDRLTLVLVNQSATVASGLRLRLDNVLELWSAETTGTFLAPKEQAAIREQIIDGYRDGTIIVPSLPPIPPNSSLEISLYGGLEIAKPTLNIVGSSIDVRKIVEVEESWLVDWYLNPWKFWSLTPFMLYVFGLVSFLVWKRAKRQTIAKETKNVLYNSACAAALEGQVDDAMAILRQAVAAGYSNIEHVKSDNDLRALHGRADFEALFGRDQRKT